MPPRPSSPLDKSIISTSLLCYISLSIPNPCHPLSPPLPPLLLKTSALFPTALLLLVLLERNTSGITTSLQFLSNLAPPNSPTSSKKGGWSALFQSVLWPPTGEIEQPNIFVRCIIFLKKSLSSRDLYVSMEIKIEHCVS